MMMSALLMTTANGISTSKWDAFYSSWLEPTLLIIGISILTFLVLMTVSGLLTRFLVAPSAQAWGKWRYRASLVLGLGCLLAVAVFVPVYPVFHPFDAGHWLFWVFTCGVIPLGVVLGAFAMWPRLGGDEPGTTEAVLPRSARVILTMIWIVLCCWFYTWGRGQQLLVADITLGVLGVAATTISLGQNMRLQVEARGSDGNVDAAATNYLLCRLQKLGSRPPEALTFSQTTDLSQLVSQDLSAIPNGAIAAAVARILYAIRPGLTWRAQITQVDAERLTVQVSRNSRLVKNAVISRPDLGLPAIPDSVTGAALTEKQDRATAQLRTGAAACVLVQLSLVHPLLKLGLCGATQWKSVALHVIATEPALAGNAAENIALLRESTDADPNYLLGRLDYLMLHYGQTKPKTAAVRRQFATLLNNQLPDTQPTDDTKPRPHYDENPQHGYEVMYLRILYMMTAMRFNACIIDLIKSDLDGTVLRKDYKGELAKITGPAQTLVIQCGRLTQKKACRDQDVRDYAEHLGPMAKNLWDAAEYLAGRTVAASHAEYRTPEIAVHHAARIGLQAEFTTSSEDQFDTVLDHLAFGVATSDDYIGVVDDPSFWLPKLRSAILTGVPGFGLDMLGLKPFAPHASALRKAGITTFRQFRARATTTAQQQTLATYLSTDCLVIAHLLDIAELATSRPQLANADVLAVFIDVGITSNADLAQRLSDDEAGLIKKLSDTADEQGRRSLDSIKNLDWLRTPAGNVTNGRTADVADYPR